VFVDNSKAKFRFSFYTSRPSTRQWSLIPLSHRGPLRGNGHRSLYIKTLCEAMVIDFFCHIEALCEAMVIDLFTSRPSARQWSLISYVISRPSARQWSLISLHQDPLRGNGHWFLLSDDDPLHGNGHRYFRYRPSPQYWSNLFFFKKSKYKKNLVFRIGTLYMVMVV